MSLLSRTVRAEEDGAGSCPSRMLGSRWRKHPKNTVTIIFYAQKVAACFHDYVRDTHVRKNSFMRFSARVNDLVQARAFKCAGPARPLHDNNRTIKATHPPTHTHTHTHTHHTKLVCACARASAYTRVCVGETGKERGTGGR